MNLSAAAWSFLLSLLFLALYWWQMPYVESLSIFYISVGLLFPGIPHGAADHWLELREKTQQPKTLFGFVSLYLMVMVVILLIWYFSPALGLLSFVAYSAWHFGQSDFEQWQIKNKLFSFLYGFGLLGFILISHLSEFQVYLEYYGLSSWVPFLQKGQMAASLLFSLSILIPLVYVSAKFRSNVILVLGVVFIGSQLPLLLAFSLYFIGIHSWRGWKQCLRLTNTSPRNLLVHSAPMTLGAIALVVLLAFTNIWESNSFLELAAMSFIFLAAISAPHVLVMHRLFQRV